MRRPPREVVDVWTIDLDAPLADPLALLDAAERRRAERLRDPRLRGRFAVAHSAARAILARYLDVHPGALTLVRRPCATCGAAHGKPAVAGDTAGLAFNLSHSERLAVLAVGRRELGVDVEWRGRPLDVEPLLDEALAGEELAAARRLPAARRRDAFLTAWVCKESVVKADGAGLALPLRDIVLEPGRRGARLLRPGLPSRRFALCALELDDPAYVAALAVTPPAPQVRLRRWPEDLDAAR